MSLQDKTINAREKALLVLKVMSGKTNDEIQKEADVKKQYIDHFLMFFRQFGIESIRKHRKPSYYYVTNEQAIREQIEKKYKVTKVCHYCGLEKSINEFKATRAGLSDACSACINDSLIISEQQCRRCGEVKPLEKFGIDNQRFNGKSSVCKDCKNEDTGGYCSNVSGYGFRSWAIIDTSNHLALFDWLGKKYWGEKPTEKSRFSEHQKRGRKKKHK